MIDRMIRLPARLQRRRVVFGALHTLHTQTCDVSISRSCHHHWMVKSLPFVVYRWRRSCSWISIMGVCELIGEKIVKEGICEIMMKLEELLEYTESYSAYTVFNERLV